MSAAGNERLRSSFSTSKLGVEHNVSESEMNVGKNKRKVSLSTPVDLEMGIENPEALLEPVVMKKTRTTGNAHSYKAKFKVKRKEEIVPVKLALGKTEKHTSYQEKEQVHSVSSEEGCLKKMNKQGSPNTTYSRRDPLVAGKSINQESSNVNEQRPPCERKIAQRKILQKKIVKDSAEKEHNENQILTQKKQAVNDKGVESQIGCFQKDPYKEEHTENQILSQQKQAVKDKGAGSEINSSGINSAMKEHNEKQILSEQKQAVKDKFKVKRKDETIPVELALGQIEKLSHQQNEQVHPHTNLRRKIVKDAAGSQIDCFQKDSFNEEHTENQILPQQRQAVKDINNFGNNSAKEEQIHSEQKQTVKDKDAGSDIHRLQIKVQKYCRKRMAKLIQKHQEQIQKFHQIWEKKRSDLERDHKLELSKIHFIRGEDSTRTNNKLKILDGLFAKKMKEHNLLKDAEFKKLETEQLSAKDEERQKEAHWLAVCRSDEPTADHGPESLGFHSEEVGPDVSFGNSSNSLSTDPQNDLGVAVSHTSVLAGVEQLDQQKNFCPRQITCALPAFRGSVLGEIGVIELNKEVPLKNPEAVPKEIGDYANPVELSNSTSKKGIDKGDAIGLPDTLVNLGDENDDAVGLPLLEQILEPSEQTNASRTPHPCTLLPPQASEDEIPCSPISDIIPDVDARVVEAQNTSPFEVAILQSNTELQGQDVPEIESQITSKIATTGITETVTPEESIVQLQGPVLEDQYTWQIENTSSEQIGTVKPVQDQSAQVVEKQKASPVEVAASVHVDSVTVDQPNIELHDQEAPDTSRDKVANLDTIDISHEELSEKFQDQDASVLENQATPRIKIANYKPVDIVNPVQSNIGAPEIPDCEELLPSDVSPCCNQPPSTEVESQNHNLERSSSQTTRTAEIADSVAVSRESASQLGGNWELRGNSLDIVSDSQVHLERNSYPTVEIPDAMLLSSESASQLWGNQNLPNNHFGMGSECQVNVDLSQIVVNTLEALHQAGLLGSAGNIYGSSNPFSNHQVNSLSSPPLYTAPFQNRLEKISKESEQLHKSHEDRKSQLKSDCQKEIQELLAQLKNKYNLKLQVAEAEYSYKRNVLDKKQSKVLRNKLLAESFSFICADRCWLGEVQQASPSSSMQYFQH